MSIQYVVNDWCHAGFLPGQIVRVGERRAEVEGMLGRLVEVKFLERGPDGVCECDVFLPQCVELLLHNTT